MTIFICVLGVDPERVDWNFPFLPRIGEHMCIADFIPDIDLTKVIGDTLKVVDIQWIKIDGEICPVLFLGDKDSEISDIKSLHLN